MGKTLFEKILEEFLVKSLFSPDAPFREKYLFSLGINDRSLTPFFKVLFQGKIRTVSLLRISFATILGIGIENGVFLLS
jgi:hypothetical protein